MSFQIRMGVPEMLALWEELCLKKKQGVLKGVEAELHKKWGKAMYLLSQDPFYPSLQTHEIKPLSKRYGRRVWQSYLENRNSRAWRMYWVYGPDTHDITVIGLEPHPEDKKRGGYEKVLLSSCEEG